MARPRKSIPPLGHLRVRVPKSLKLDIETIVSLKETTISAVLREAICDYLERSHKQDDDPIFPNDVVKERPRGGYCEDYIRFQLPAEMKNEFQKLVKKRGLIVSVLLRLMAEHYVKANSLQDILGEFQKEVQENAFVG
jgi:hypothetical protein